MRRHRGNVLGVSGHSFRYVPPTNRFPGFCSRQVKAADCWQLCFAETEHPANHRPHKLQLCCGMRNPKERPNNHMFAFLIKETMNHQGDRSNLRHSKQGRDAIKSTKPRPSEMCRRSAPMFTTVCYTSTA